MSNTNTCPVCASGIPEFTKERSEALRAAKLTDLCDTHKYMRRSDSGRTAGETRRRLDAAKRTVQS